MVIDKLVLNPACCRTANHHHHVVPMASPVVPEPLKSRHELRPWRIHPWQFIKENHDSLTLVLLFHQLREHQEGINPTRRLMRLAHAVLLQRDIELLQLQLHQVYPRLLLLVLALRLLVFDRRKTCMTKRQLTSQCLINQERLANTPTTIYCHK